MLWVLLGEDVGKLIIEDILPLLLATIHLRVVALKIFKLVIF